jgi:hypothetical protein
MKQMPFKSSQESNWPGDRVENDPNVGLPVDGSIIDIKPGEYSLEIEKKTVEEEDLEKRREVVESLSQPGEDFVRKVKKNPLIGRTCKVLRTSGELEDDWVFLGDNGGDRVVLRKRNEVTGEILTKEVRSGVYQEWQMLKPELAEEKA